MDSFVFLVMHMSFYIVPGRNHPIYVEWKRLSAVAQSCVDRGYVGDGFAYAQAADAVKSIERIAEHIYKDHPCIVGHMIIQRDLETIEAEQPTEVA